MYIEETLRNVRCDTIGCHKMAMYNISTNSYKGNTSLCIDCFTSLYSAMQKIKNPKPTIKQKTKGEN